MTNKRDGLLKSFKIANVVRRPGAWLLMHVKAAGEGCDI